MAYDFGHKVVNLPEGVFHDGKAHVDMSSNFLRGRLLDDNNNVIKVPPHIEEDLKIVYSKRIIPLFGEFDNNNVQIKKGLVIFREQRTHPTAIFKDIMSYADENGKFTHSGPEEHQKISGYIPNNPDKYTIIITDHLRKLNPERGFNLKQTVDKMISYHVDIRNWTGFTFVDIIHTNRNLTSVDNMKFSGEELYPKAEDIKETGNLSEDADYVFTIMNPNDSRYRLTEHFNLKLRDGYNNPLYPNLRTIHLVESRHSHYPVHFKTSMIGSYKSFERLDV